MVELYKLVALHGNNSGGCDSGPAATRVLYPLQMVWLSEFSANWLI